MTAINAVLKKDRAVLMTDAAMYTPEGLVVGFGQKAVAMPTLKAAIACRGAQKLAALLAMELSITFQSFDQLLRAGPQFFHRWATRIGDMLAIGTDADVSTLHAVQIVVVGWSDERREAVGFYYDTTTDEPFGLIDEWVFGPLPDVAEDANLHVLGCEMDVDIDARTFEPVLHGIHLMNAQRRMRIVPHGGEADAPISVVGGHILLTEVTEHGVSQMVVFRWPDVAGEPIEPLPFTPAVAMNRAERRRMAKVGQGAA